MKTQYKHEKGSLMLEVIAVLGLMALITPILFNQIRRRNEEIVDTQIATEMRAVKDAVSAYIQANERELAKSCELICTTTNGCQDTTTETTIPEGDYISTGENEIDCGITPTESELKKYFSGSSSILGEYDYHIYAYTVKQGDNSYRPVIYAYIVQTTPMQNLRRAAKVASLIGLEGGVSYGGSIKGMQGVWEADDITADKYAVVATTSFDDATNSAILKDATFSHMQASGSVQAPVMATERLGVNDILTVDSSENCILDYKNDSVTIQTNGETTGTDEETKKTCAPFFEVNPVTKEVHLAGVIRTGKYTQNKDNCTGTTRKRCEDIPYCTWISACSGETTQKDCESAGCRWAESSNSCYGSSGSCVGEYLLDPSQTSMVKDLKLTNRGGAKLSELLPDWSLRRVITKKFDNFVTTPWEVPIPTCPANHRPALIILSSGLQGNGVLSVNAQTLANTIRDTETVLVKEDKDASISIDNIEEKNVQTIKSDASFESEYNENKVTIDGAIRYVINNKTYNQEDASESSLLEKEDDDERDYVVWIVTPEYWERTGETTGEWKPIQGNFTNLGLSAVIHTYCVANCIEGGDPKYCNTEEECVNHNFGWNGSKCVNKYTGDGMTGISGGDMTEENCEDQGGTWCAACGKYDSETGKYNGMCLWGLAS